MATDIRLNDDAVLVDGALGLGTNSPKRQLHVENSEIHTGGGSGGYSFADRSATTFQDAPANGQRWVWYASGGRARLWSGADGFTLRRTGSTFTAEIGGALKVQQVDATAVTAGAVASPRYTGERVDVTGWVRADEVNGRVVNGEHGRFTGTLQAKDISAKSLSGGTRLFEVVAARLRGEGTTAPQIRFVTTSLALQDPAAPETMPGEPTEVVAPPSPSAVPVPPPPPTPPIPPQQVPIPPRLALAHDFGPSRDSLVLNSQKRYAQGVRLEGNVHVDGVLTEASSIALKEEVRPLSGTDALAALRELAPVRYQQRADGTQRVGFIAEEVPDLVACQGRDRLRPMDIVAVLTGAVQAQQRRIDELAARLADRDRP